MYGRGPEDAQPAPGPSLRLNDAAPVHSATAPEATDGRSYQASPGGLLSGASPFNMPGGGVVVPPCSSVEQLWSSAFLRPGHPAVGMLPDGHQGWVACAVLYHEGEVTVSLDLPADNVVDAFAAVARDESWYIAGRRAMRFNSEGPIRYVLCLSPRTRIESRMGDE